MNFYNENDPQKGEWLRWLIKRNVIAKGKVDERSIKDIDPIELDRFRQCHFFAGIGIWSYALRLAGISDSEEVWTGSCPCQPFSVAGKKKGEADERHLWPAWFSLIAKRRPVTVFGEQVADGDGQTWLDYVQADLESVGYRFGSLTLPASCIGAPHGRHRTFFVADTKGRRDNGRTPERRRRDASLAALCSEYGGMANATGAGRNGRRISQKSARQRKEQRLERNARQLGDSTIEGNGTVAGGHQGQCESHAGGTGATCNALEHAKSVRSHQQSNARDLRKTDCSKSEHVQPNSGLVRPGPTNGFWSNVEWVPCRGKIPGTIEWRAIKPSSLQMADGTASDILRMCNYGFPLAKGKTQEARSLRIKGYGDAIVAPVAAEFIKAYYEIQNAS